MTSPYQAVLKAAEAATGPAQELELKRATAAMNELLGRITELQQAVYDGCDSWELIRARVAGTGRLATVDISAQAIRDIPSAELGQHCLEAVAAARVAMGEAMRQGLADLSDGNVQWDAAVPGDPVEYWHSKMAERP
ncbi:MAG TPA: hypothetical protein VK453_01850 [Micromonosporaceae bacterium]|nr:hypothetical protein [Micromonosporaceae bacterium]